MKAITAKQQRLNQWIKWRHNKFDVSIGNAHWGKLIVFNEVPMIRIIIQTPRVGLDIERIMN